MWNNLARKTRNTFWDSGSWWDCLSVKHSLRCPEMRIYSFYPFWSETISLNHLINRNESVVTVCKIALVSLNSQWFLEWLRQMCKSIQSSCIHCWPRKKKIKAVSVLSRSFNLSASGWESSSVQRAAVSVLRGAQGLICREWRLLSLVLMTFSLVAFASHLPGSILDLGQWLEWIPLFSFVKPSPRNHAVNSYLLLGNLIVCIFLCVCKVHALVYTYVVLHIYAYVIHIHICYACSL